MESEGPCRPNGVHQPHLGLRTRYGWGTTLPQGPPPSFRALATAEVRECRTTGEQVSWADEGKNSCF